MKIAHSEQALQDDTGISRASTAFGGDTTIAPPLTGEYLLHSKGHQQGWVGAGHRHCLFVWLGSLFGWLGGFRVGKPPAPSAIHFQPQYGLDSDLDLLVGKLDGSRTNSCAINHEKPCSASRRLYLSVVQAFCSF